MSEHRHHVASADDVPQGEVVHLQVPGIREGIVLCRTSSGFYALEDMCTHAYATLSDGQLEDHTLICPRHGGGFDVTTGEAKLPPCFEDVRTFRVEVEEGSVFVVVSEEATA